MIKVRRLAGLLDYELIWQAMRDYTDERNSSSDDEIWLLEHSPVYTLGQAGLPEHVLNAHAIPLVKTDRGGQVTYHGPGQLVAYCLIDLRRMGMYVKEYVALLESVVLDVLAELGLSTACKKQGAPGVYVPAYAVQGEHADPNELVKIAALGIKVRQGRCYHGLSLNVDMDLTPFLGINPCGYQGLETTDLRHCGVLTSMPEVSELLSQKLTQAFLQRQESAVLE